MRARTVSLLAVIALAAAGRSRAAESQAGAPRGDATDVKPLPVGLTPAQVFRSGQELIAANSGDATGWSRPAVEAGIERVQKSLADGFRDRAAAHRALSAGYEAMWSRYELDARERTRYRRLQAEASKKVWELTSDPRWGLDWAVALPDDKESLAACRAVAAKHPRHAPARLAVAVALCRTGPSSEGLKNLLAGISLLGPEEIAARRNDLTSQGFQCGGGQGFASVEKAIAARNGKK